MLFSFPSLISLLTPIPWVALQLFNALPVSIVAMGRGSTFDLDVALWQDFSGLTEVVYALEFDILSRTFLVQRGFWEPWLNKNSQKYSTRRLFPLLPIYQKVQDQSGFWLSSTAGFCPPQTPQGWPQRTGDGPRQALDHRNTFTTRKSGTKKLYETNHLMTIKMDLR